MHANMLASAILYTHSNFHTVHTNYIIPVEPEYGAHMKPAAEPDKVH